jgi:hypothetical protein
VVELDVGRAIDSRGGLYHSRDDGTEKTPPAISFPQQSPALSALTTGDFMGMRDGEEFVEN